VTGAATDSSSTRLPDLLASVVRGDPIEAARWPAIDIDAFCAAAEAHGVLPLVADRMRRMTSAAAPGALAARVAHLAEQHAVLDLERESALRAALAALDEAGLQPLVFKGAHLAYRDYARPDLRPRVDSDVLIPPDHRARDAAGLFAGSAARGTAARRGAHPAAGRGGARAVRPSRPADRVPAPRCASRGLRLPDLAV